MEFKNRDRLKETFRNIGHNDTNEKDDSIQPVVAKNECNDEEGHTKKHGDSCDEMNEMCNFTGNWCFVVFKPRCQVRDTTHDSSITCIDNYTLASTCRQTKLSPVNVKLYMTNG